MNDDKPWLDYIRNSIPDSEETPAFETNVFVPAKDVYMNPFETLGVDKINKHRVIDANVVAQYLRCFFESHRIVEGKKVVFKDPLVRLEYVHKLALQATAHMLRNL